MATRTIDPSGTSLSSVQKAKKEQMKRDIAAATKRVNKKKKIGKAKRNMK